MTHRIALTSAAALLCIAAAGGLADQPLQWANSPGHNMVIDAANLPVTLTEANRLWRTPLGGKWAWPQPTVAGDKLLIATDIRSVQGQRLRKATERANGSAVMCLDARTGAILWQLPSPAYGYHGASYGACGSVVVRGGRAYVYFTHFVLCLDLEGQANGNDGPFEAELRYMTSKHAEPPRALLDSDGDILWAYAMRRHQPVHHDGVGGSVVVDDDYVYVPTSHCCGSERPGAAWKKGDRRAYTKRYCPNLVVLDRRTGRLVATDDIRVPEVFHGQWSTPTLAQANGRTLILYGDGFGVLHAFAKPEPVGQDGEPRTLERIWWFDCNPPDLRAGTYPTEGMSYPEKRKLGKGPAEIIATPVFHKSRVFVAIGRDDHWSNRNSFGALTCIDPTGTGDVTGTHAVWQNRDVGRTQATVSVSDDGLLFLPDDAGMMHCIDAETGKHHWTHELNHGVTCRSQLLADGKVYVQTDKKKRWYVFAASDEKKLLFEGDSEKAAYATPAAVDGRMFVLTPKHVSAYGTVEGAR